MKELRCGDVMSGCKHVFRGYTEPEVLRKAGEHGIKAHHISTFDAELEKRVYASIRDVEDSKELDPKDS